MTWVYVCLLVWVLHALNRCFDYHCMCRCVRYNKCLSTLVHMFQNTLRLCRVCTCRRSCIRSFVLKRWGMIVDYFGQKAIERWGCNLYLFYLDRGLKCVCVYACTRTLHVEFAMIKSSRVGTRHLESPRNLKPVGPNFGITWPG